MDELRKGIAIGMLFGSGSANLMEKTATENGVYTAAEEIDPETEEIFDPPKDGYSVFTVDLALDDKRVSLTTSQITGSQTAEFEYDPHDENPELEGYSLFTIDLSAVKTDIEDLQQQIADLEDALEDCHDCWEEVVAALQQYDPGYDPEEGECPADKVTEVVDKVEELEEQVEECDQCKADVIEKLQEYDPNFDPVTCSDIPPEIDKIVEEESGYNPPVGTPIEDIIKIMDIDDTVKIEDNSYYFNWYMWYSDDDIHENLMTQIVGRAHDFVPRVDIYDEDGEFVTYFLMANSQRYNIYDASDYFKVTSFTINYTNKEFTCNIEYTYHNYYGQQTVTETWTHDMSAYLDTTSANPRYKMKNS